MTSTVSRPWQKLLQLGLVPQIIIGILLGVLVAVVSPELAKNSVLVRCLICQSFKSYSAFTGVCAGGFSYCQ